MAEAGLRTRHETLQPLVQALSGIPVAEVAVISGSPALEGVIPVLIPLLQSSQGELEGFGDRGRLGTAGFADISCRLLRFVCLCWEVGTPWLTSSLRLPDTSVGKGSGCSDRAGATWSVPKRVVSSPDSDSRQAPRPRGSEAAVNAGGEP